MKITYFKLENSAGIEIGTKKNSIEIDFSKSKNRIISIQAKNGSGKSTLLSALTPFSGVLSSIDERGSINFIKPKTDGYKEIHYSLNGDNFVIKHYYKANKEGGHSVKSYFAKNEEELNKNGNVTSFNLLVENYFGLTQEMLRLIRIGSNITSFVNLQPSKRKEYIGKLINNIEIYNQIYKKINDDLRVIKVLISTNTNNILKLNISNLDDEIKLVKKNKKQLEDIIKQKEILFSEIKKNEALQKSNNINELKNEINNKTQILNNFNLIENQFKQLKDTQISNTDKDKIIQSIIEIQSLINSSQLEKDKNLVKIEKLEQSLMKISSNENINSIKENIKLLENKIKNYSPVKLGVDSFQIQSCLNTLISLNSIGNIINSFDKIAITKFINLKKTGKSISKFIKNAYKKSLIFEKIDFTQVLKQLFSNDSLIEPNCLSEFKECPFYRISEFVLNNKNEEILNQDSIKQIEMLEQNFNFILSELNKFAEMDFPDKIKNLFKQETILNNIQEHSLLFCTDDISELLFISKQNDIFYDSRSRLEAFKQQLKNLNSVGVEQIQEEIKQLENENLKLEENISKSLNQRKELNLKLNQITNDLNLITEYNSQLKIIDSVKNSLLELSTKLTPLLSAEKNLFDLKLKYSYFQDQIKTLETEIKLKENQIESFKHLTKEADDLKVKLNEMTMIHESVSTKKGIPVVYIRSYLERIHSFANSLLKIVYDGEIELGKFAISNDSFEIPFIKNGQKISDIRYGSQSEISLITMALSFAISKSATSCYNILLLDEVDAGLDDDNKLLFMQMLNAQLEKINAEQIFIISHNFANGLLSIPLDVIKLSETGFNSKLFNVIYE